MAKILQCPWCITGGLFRMCMNGRFPCDCDTCDSPDKHFVETTTTTTASAGNSECPVCLKENNTSIEDRIEKLHTACVHELEKIQDKSSNAALLLLGSKSALERLCPELKDGEDERIRKGLISMCQTLGKAEWVAWLEMKGDQKPAMIQWKGDNLKEVVDFTGGYKEGFEKWFHNSWKEYEKYVHEHNNIFKIFNEDGSHIEVPVGAWIIKSPDGYNTASRFGFVPKPAEWSEEDERLREYCINAINGIHYYSPENKQELVGWLKSLRPQSTWRPSKEQIKVCKEVYGDLLSAKGFNIGTVNSELNRLEEKFKETKRIKL